MKYTFELEANCFLNQYDKYLIEVSKLSYYVKNRLCVYLFSLNGGKMEFVSFTFPIEFVDDEMLKLVYDTISRDLLKNFEINKDYIVDPQEGLVFHTIICFQLTQR